MSLPDGTMAEPVGNPPEGQIRWLLLGLLRVNIFGEGLTARETRDKFLLAKNRVHNNDAFWGPSLMVRGLRLIEL